MVRKGGMEIVMVRKGGRDGDSDGEEGREGWR